MACLPKHCFPFDGSCEGSKDADIILCFDGDETLHAHSLLLKMVSPVFKAMLTDCIANNNIDLSSDNKLAVQLLLNTIHPTAPPVITADKSATWIANMVSEQLPISTKAVDAQEALLNVSEKYQADAVRDRICAAANDSIRTTTHYLTAYSSSHADLNPAIPSKLEDKDKTDLFSIIVFCAKWGFEDGFDAGLEYIKSILRFPSTVNYVQHLDYGETPTGEKIFLLMEKLNGIGRHDHVLRVARDIIYNIRVYNTVHNREGMAAFKEFC